MSLGSYSVRTIESSSEAIYSSLDSCNSMTCKQEEAMSNPYIFPDTSVSLNKMGVDVCEKPSDKDKLSHPPNISSTRLEKLIEFELVTSTKTRNGNQFSAIVHMIMRYFHSMQSIPIYFITMNGSAKSKMSSSQIIMYKEDNIVNLQKKIAWKYNVSGIVVYCCYFCYIF